MLNKAFDPNVDTAEFTREYYRKQGEERLFRKIREASYDVNDLTFVARLSMLLNEIEFGKVEDE